MDAVGSGPAASDDAVAANSPVAVLGRDERIVHRDRLPARQRRSAPLPTDLAPEVRDLLQAAGVVDLHRFQAAAIEHVRRGRHVVLAGGTGAGKSLCYQVPMLELLAAADEQGRKRSALYLAPTKSLAQDQARRLRDLGASWAQPMLYDGDTAKDQRAQVRRRAQLLLTNPDMLSIGILPAHEQWAVQLRGLSMVVLDEAHVYRGVFGSHVAQVLRRLRRILSLYGNDSCRFVLSSATIGNPVAHARRLTGLDVELVDDSGAPRSCRDVLMWNPSLDEDSGNRDSAIGDAARMYARLIEAGVPTIVFTRSRRQCELIHRFCVEQLQARGLDRLVDRIAPYRAGYTPAQRRETERDLAGGVLLGVVATSALELGIDIGSLRASIVVTYPGTTTSLLQRWGRAARVAGSTGLCVLVAGDDALDQYFMRNPVELLERPIEDAVVSLDNDRILLPHLAAGAAEAPLGLPVDDQLWPDGRWQGARDTLVQQGLVRDAPGGAVFVGNSSIARSISLRSAGRGDVSIVEASGGEVIGVEDVGRAAVSVHPGATYLHRGEQYLVESLDVQHLVARVRRRTMPYYTHAKVDTDIQVGRALDERDVAGGRVTLRRGRVLVTDQHVGYQRIDAQTHRPLGLVDQQLPPLAFETEAVWFASPLAPMPVPAQLDPADPLGERRFLGALHAAEHALIAMLPLLATCDRWDIGGLSTNWHDAFDGAGIFVYDGHPGGIGITQVGFERFEEWAATTHSMLAGCPCDSGCPACIQSPKCGNLNEPLDKLGALDVLASLCGLNGGWSS